MWTNVLYHRARSQHGVVTRQQVTDAAPSSATARHELSLRHWQQEGERVFRLLGTPTSPRQQLMTALLDAGAGAVVSHESSTSLWGVPGWRLIPAHVTRKRNTSGRSVDFAIRHSARCLPDDQITVLDGFRVTRPERIPFDLANVGTPAPRVERVMDRLWSDRLVSGRSLRRVLASLPRRGFRGTAMMRELLSARPNDWIPPASGLESRALVLLNSRGYDGFERQVDLGDDEWIGRVDFVDPALRIVIEVQSDRHHAALSSQRDDQQRFDRLISAGFDVMTVWEDELWYRPQPFLERLQRKISHRKT